MAGFLFAMKSMDDIEECIRSGVYSTYVSGSWNRTTYSTLGDYFSMKPGDNIYFFNQRKIYGIGEIRSFGDEVTVINNYKDDSEFTTNNRNTSLLRHRTNDSGRGKVQRWVINFTPAPAFYEIGVDMDDLLDSNPPAFRILRAFSGRSFIKFDDEENAAFKAGIFQKNLSTSARRVNGGEPQTVRCDNESTLERFTRTLADQGETFEDRATNLRHLIALKRGKRGVRAGEIPEMLVEDAIINALVRQDTDAERAFGHWDYVSHQVPASPMKPSQYMDYMDVFGYRWIQGLDEKIIDQFLIIEIKKDVSDGLNDGSAVATQIMKYVDWVCQHYAGGDYAQIKAFIVAHDFHPQQGNRSQIQRKYITTNREQRTSEWEDVTLVTYDTDAEGDITFRPYQSTAA